MMAFFNALKNEVPAREEKRHKERQIKKEIYCLERYLRMPSCSQRLSFPLEVIQVQEGEFPDFRIVSPRGVIGLEVTEATEENYQQHLTLLYETGELHDAKIYNGIGGMGAGNSVELQCANTVVKSIIKKTAKLLKHLSKNVDINHYELLIYVNINLEPDPKKMFGFIRESLRPDHGFEYISIITSASDNNGEYLLYKINTDYPIKWNIACK